MGHLIKVARKLKGDLSGWGVWILAFSYIEGKGVVVEARDNVVSWQVERSI